MVRKANKHPIRLISKSSVSNVRSIQNFRIVLLDSSINEINNDDSINTITK